MTFIELKNEIVNAPVEWHAALFMVAVKACLKSKAWRKGEMEKYCREEETQRDSK